MKTFEETDAWKAAREVARISYRLCRAEPLVRDFGLCDQLRRAAVSCMNNIAEGWESIHLAEKRQAYNYARRSCGEVRSMTYVLVDNSLAPSSEISSLRENCIRAGQLVSGLLRSLDAR